MTETWGAASRVDLIIEVWEKLDCEDVGRSEIEAIRTVIDDRFGLTPADTPMKLARLLADEGAVLRHSEILEFDVEVRVSRQTFVDDVFEVDVSSREAALASIEELERRRAAITERGLPLKSLRASVMRTRDLLQRVSEKREKSMDARAEAREIAEWLSLWLQSPDMFRSWIQVRMAKMKK